VNSLSSAASEQIVPGVGAVAGRKPRAVDRLTKASRRSLNYLPRHCSAIYRSHQPAETTRRNYRVKPRNRKPKSRLTTYRLDADSEDMTSDVGEAVFTRPRPRPRLN